MQDPLDKLFARFGPEIALVSAAFLGLLSGITLGVIIEAIRK